MNARSSKTRIRRRNGAARALEANHIGAIIVQEGGRVVGVVRDRDRTCWPTRNSRRTDAAQVFDAPPTGPGSGQCEPAVAAFEVVASGLVRRLTASEAQHFTSQLPSTIRERLLDLLGGPDLEVTRESIERDMAHRLELDRESAAMLVREVCASLGELVSPGEVRNVVNQLPCDMKEFFAHPA